MTRTEDIKRVLITGATGFIGSHLTQRLAERGLEVGIIARENYNVWRIKSILDKIKIYNTDIQNSHKILKVVSDFKPDAIYHLAAYYAVEHKLEEIRAILDTNILGVINLLEASKESNVKLFVNTSSCFVYKESKDKLREDSRLGPLNLYALTKIYAEDACSFYSEKYRLNCVTFRLFTPYGPRDHERRLVPYAIKSLLNGERPNLTSGEQKWDFIYVDDIVEAYSKLLNFSRLPLKHEIFNIGTGEAVSIRQVVLRLKEILGSDLNPKWGAIPHRKNEIWFSCADTSKAKTLLQWEPKVKLLENGLRLTVERYKEFVTGG